MVCQQDSAHDNEDNDDCCPRLLLGCDVNRKMAEWIRTDLVNAQKEAAVESNPNSSWPPTLQLKAG